MRTTLLTLLTAAVVVAGATPAVRADPLRFLAVSGEQADGLPDGATYSFLADAVINAAGDVAFFATVTGGGTSAADNQLVYVGTPGNLDIVARRGSRAPGTGGSDYAALTFDLALRDSGRVVFRGSIDGADDDADGGFWVGRPGSLDLIAREGAAAPGTTVSISGDSFFPNVAARTFCVNDAGAAAFRAFLVGDVTAANDEALFSGAAGAVGLLAREGDAAPDAGGAVFAERSPRLAFPSLCLGDDGTAVFLGTLSGAGVGFRNRDGLWAGTPGDVSLVARGGQTEDAFEGGRVFRAFSSGPTVNASGEIFFDALTTDAAGNFPKNALLVADGAGFLGVARQGDPAPDDPDGLDFGSGFSDLALNAAGRVAFLARLVDGDAVVRESIYTGTPGDLTLVARDGAPVPGLAGVTFVNPGDPFLGVDGTLVFRSNLAGDGVAIGTNDIAVWTAAPDGSLTLLARTGDAVVVGDDTKVMQGFALYDGENAGDAGGGRGSPIGAAGEVVLTVTFDDFSTALAVTTEPFGFPAGEPPPPGPGGDCDSLDACLTALAAALPDPDRAESRRPRKAAKKLGKFNKKLRKAAAKRETATKDRKRRKLAKKIRKLALKIQLRSISFDAQDRLAVPQEPITAITNRLTDFVVD